MPYATRNPIPSTDPRDLYDNSAITDIYVNGDIPFTPDRMGLLRRTWKGMEADFDNAQQGRQDSFEQFLEQSALIWIGDYGAGLTFTSRSQYMVRDGMAYRLATSTTLPYTTTGNWTLEQTKFSLVNSDQVLRQDLAATGDVAKGAALVARGAECVDSIADLLTRSTAGGRHISVASYHPGWAASALGPLGGSVWAWDATEPKANHNGFDRISPTVPWNGTFATLSAFQNKTGETAPGTNGCWVRLHGGFNLVSWGCIPAVATNNFDLITHAVQYSAANKRKLKLSKGTFEFGTTLDFDYPTLRVVGDGFRNSVLKYTGSGRAIQALGLRPNHNAFSFDWSLSYFTVEGNASVTDLIVTAIHHARIVHVNLREASSSNGCGLRVLGSVAGHFEQITMSTNTQVMVSRPYNGIVFDIDPLIPGARPTCNTLVSPCIEGAMGDGIVLVQCDQLLVIGGTSENNGGNGLTENSTCQMNTYIGFDCESNLGFADIFLAGHSSKLENCGSTRYTYIDNSARGTKIEGGWFDKVEVGVGAVGVELSKLKTRFFGGAVGLVTNNNPFLSTKDIFDVAANTYVFYAKPATVIINTASPMNYLNGNTVSETVLINPNGGNITQISYRRGGAAVGNVNPSTGTIVLQPGDGLTFNYTGSPIFTRVPGGTNYQ